MMFAKMKPWPYEIEALNRRLAIEVKVLDVEEYDDGFPPSDLKDLASWAKGIVERVPKQYRSTAQIRFGAKAGYDGDAEANIKVVYSRDETDEEWQARKANVTARLSEFDHSERAQYEALKAKYGDK